MNDGPIINEIQTTDQSYVRKEKQVHHKSDTPKTQIRYKPQAVDTLGRLRYIN